MRSLLVLLNLVSLEGLPPTSSQHPDSAHDKFLSLLVQREQRVCNVRVSLDVTTEILPGHKEFYYAQHRSMQVIRRSASLPPPPEPRPYSERNILMVTKKRLRFVRGPGGLVRWERTEFNDEGKTSTKHETGFDGTNWWTASEDSLIFQRDGSRLDHEGIYLGLEYDWNLLSSPGVAQGQRSLASTLSYFDKLGFVTIKTPSDNSSEATVIVRRPIAIPRPGRPPAFCEDVFVFSPEFGMAPVRYSSRQVQVVEGKYLTGGTTCEGSWTGFEEVVPGIWLPRNYVAIYSHAVLFPKQGDVYPPGFDGERATLADFRLEWYKVKKVSAHVTSIELITDVNTTDFSPKPEDYDYIHYEADGKTLIRHNEEERLALRQLGFSGNEGNRITLRGLYLFLLFNVVILLLLLGFFLRHVFVKGKRAQITTQDGHTP